MLQQEAGSWLGNSKALGGRRGPEDIFGVPKGRGITIARSGVFSPFQSYIEWGHTLQR
jgi:hypothetical protein